MASPFRWIHYEAALPILAGVDIPKVLDLYIRGTKALAPITKDKPKDAPDPTIPEVITALGPDFITDAMDLIRSIDPKAFRRLAMIASASVEDMEAAESDDAKEKTMLTNAGRMEPGEVIAKALFFIGMRLSPTSHAPASSGDTSQDLETQN